MGIGIPRLYPAPYNTDCGCFETFQSVSSLRLNIRLKMMIYCDEMDGRDWKVCSSRYVRHIGWLVKGHVRPRLQGSQATERASGRERAAAPLSG